MMYPVVGAVEEVHAPLTQVWPVAQTFAQAPQLFGSVCKSRQALGEHWQVWLPVHALPQVPQLALSVAGLTQELPHTTMGELHVWQ
jgi:hypothetical protein